MKLTVCFIVVLCLLTRVDSASLLSILRNGVASFGDAWSDSGSGGSGSEDSGSNDTGFFGDTGFGDAGFGNDSFDAIAEHFVQISKGNETYVAHVKI